MTSSDHLLADFIDGRASREEVGRALAAGEIPAAARDLFEALLDADAERPLASIELPPAAAVRLAEAAGRAAETPRGDLVDAVVAEATDGVPGAARELSRLCDAEDVDDEIQAGARQARSLLRHLSEAVLADAEPTPEALDRLLAVARRESAELDLHTEREEGAEILAFPGWAQAPAARDLVLAAEDPLSESGVRSGEDAADGVAAWWRAVEAADARRGLEGQADVIPGPGFARTLAFAHWAELAFRPAEAHEHLRQLGPDLPRPWRDVEQLLSLRADVRTNVADVLERRLPRIQGLATDEQVDAATRARAWHLVAIVHLRFNRFEAAEEALHRALTLADAGRLRTWLLDSMGQVLVGLGGHEEARRVLEHVARRKAESGDSLGSAITAGHLCLLDLEHARPAAAEARARDTLERLGADLPIESRLRLGTFWLQALLDRGASVPELDPAATHVRTCWDQATVERRHLKGFAALALARGARLCGQTELVREWLGRARDSFTHADERLLVSYWEARLQPEVAAREGWFEDMLEQFERAGTVTHAEVLTYLYVVERVRRSGEALRLRSGATMTAEELVTRALARAEQANVAAWVAEVEEVLGRIDPAARMRHVVKRFTGLSAPEIDATRRVEVTVVTADLVGFSTLATRLDPEQVMETVRGLWHLAGPLLIRHHVRPVEYRGDMIVAVAEGEVDGEGHAMRGLRFAADFVRRVGSVGAIRHLMGEERLSMRAGVASGPVVSGLLGNYELFGFATIGVPTNVAARLQALASPGEVVCSGEVARAARGHGVTCERVELKGMEHLPLDAMRIDPSRWPGSP